MYPAGSVDFLVQVAAESPDALREFVPEYLSASRQFASTETSLVFDHVRGTPRLVRAPQPARALLTGTHDSRATPAISNSLHWLPPPD